MKAINVKFGHEPSANPNGQTKLDAAVGIALEAVNGKANQHTFTNLYEINEIVRCAEEKLENLGIAKKDRPGAKVYATSGGAVPKNYKYKRVATDVTLERRASGWFLIRIESTHVYELGGGDDLLSLTAAQDAIAVANLRKTYSVQKTA